MKRVLQDLCRLAFVVSLVLFAVSAQPIAAVGPQQPTARVIVMGGPPDAIISVSQAAGAGVTEMSAPTGATESVTSVSSTGQTEIFVPVGTTSDVFIWSPSKGYTFLGTVAPNAADGPLTLTAK